MPALQTVTVNDRSTPTPVAHVFTPRDVSKGTGLVVRGNGVPVGEERLTVAMRKAAAKFRGKVTLTVPVVVTQTIDGVSSPVVARSTFISMEVTFDERSTPQERTDAIGIFANALAPSVPLVHGAIVGLEGVYGS